MKTTSFCLFQFFLALGVALSAHSAFAARPKAKSAPISAESGYSDTLIQSSSAETGGSISRFGLGVSTIGVGGSDTSASIWMDLSGAQSIQILFGIGGTSPFQAGIGGIFRHTVKGNRAHGFHLGGGASVASLSSGGKGSSVFSFSVGPVAGFHFGLPGLSNIQFSLDAGATLAVTDGNANFGVGALSSALGLSVHYF